MPGTVTTDLVLFAGATTGSSHCDSITDWTGVPTPTVDTVQFVQNTGSLQSYSAGGTTSRTWIFACASKDVQNQVIYFWFSLGKVAWLNTKEAGGLKLRIEDANGYWGEWYVAGSNTLPHNGFICHAVHTSMGFQATNGTVSKSAVTKITITALSAAFPGKAYLWIDAVRIGTYLQIKSGTLASPGTLEDIITAETTVANQWGVMSKIEGIYFLQGQLLIGSTTGGEATYFKDTNQVLQFKNVLIPTNFYEVKLQGNTTASTQVFLGTKSGTSGIQGCFIRAFTTQKWKLTTSDTNLSEFGFYGCNLINSDTITGQAYSTQWIASGAGDTTYNGTYVKTGTWETKDYYVYAGNRYLYWNGTRWQLYSALNSTTTCAYYGTGTDLPGIPWTASDGTPPAPRIFGLKEFIDTAFNADAELLSANGVVNKCTFISSPARAVRMIGTGTSHNITASNFISCAQAINIPGAGTYTFDALKFSGNTKDIDNTSGGYVVAMCENGANPQTYTGNTVSGAGTAAYNGTYAPTGTWNTKTYFKYSTDRYLYWNGTRWQLYTELNSTDTCAYYGTGATLPATPWTVSGGAPDPPTLSAFTDIQNSVTISILVVDTANNPIENAQVAVFKVSDNAQLMNEDTLGTGYATESYNYLADVDVYVRARKSFTGQTKYIPYSTTGTIKSTGLTIKATLAEDTTA